MYTLCVTASKWGISMVVGIAFASQPLNRDLDVGQTCKFLLQRSCCTAPLTPIPVLTTELLLASNPTSQPRFYKVSPDEFYKSLRQLLPHSSVGHKVSHLQVLCLLGMFTCCGIHHVPHPSNSDASVQRGNQMLFSSYKHP